ncbi:MAG TPA: OsmC family protein [Gemmatimonadaceae bacterium]
MLAVKIILLSEDAIRLEAVPGPMTIEALSADQMYSPFHMLASGLATCTFSVMYAWASHAGLDAHDLALEVHWTFADNPHRVESMHLIFDWPSLPERRHAAALRVAEMCTIHATLHHPPQITVSAAEEPMPRSPGDDDAAAPHEHAHSENWR